MMTRLPSLGTATDTKDEALDGLAQGILAQCPIDRVGSGAIITYRRGEDGLFDTILGGVQDACIANAL